MSFEDIWVTLTVLPVGKSVEECDHFNEHMGLYCMLPRKHKGRHWSIYYPDYTWKIRQPRIRYRR